MAAQQDMLNQSQSAIRQQLQFNRQDRKDFRPITLQSARLALRSARDDRQFYDQQIRPVHRQYVQTALKPIKPRTAQVARDAMLKANAPFDKVDHESDRRLSLRGLDPSSGQARGLRRDTGMRRATARTHGITNAVENEKRRVSDLRFSRLQAASESGAGLRTPTQQTGLPMGGTGNAASQAAALAGQYGGLAQQYRQRTSSTLANAIDLADRFSTTSKYVDTARQLTQAGGGNPVAALKTLGNETLKGTGSWGDLFAGPNTVGGTSSLYAAPGTAGEFAAFGDAPFNMISETGIGTAPNTAAAGASSGASSGAASFFNSNAFGLGVLGAGLALTQLHAALKGGSSNKTKTGKYLNYFNQSAKAGYRNLDSIILDKKWAKEDGSNLQYVVNDAVERGLINGEYITLHAGDSIVDMWNADPAQFVSLSDKLYQTSYGLTAKQAKEYRRLRQSSQLGNTPLGRLPGSPSVESTQEELKAFEAKYLTEKRKLASAKKLAAKYKKAGIPRKQYSKLADYIEGKAAYQQMKPKQRKAVRSAADQVVKSLVAPSVRLNLTEGTISHGFKHTDSVLDVLSNPGRYGAVGKRIKRLADRFGVPAIKQQILEARSEYYTQLQETAAQYRNRGPVENEFKPR